MSRQPLEPHDLPSEMVILPSYLLRIRLRPENDPFACDFDLVQRSESSGSAAYPTSEHLPLRNEIGPVTTSLAQAEILVEGFVKWDGCTQFWTSQVHVDDRTDLQEYLDAIAAARRECAQRLGSDVSDEYREL